MRIRTCYCATNLEWMMDAKRDRLRAHRNWYLEFVNLSNFQNQGKTDEAAYCVERALYRTVVALGPRRRRLTGSAGMRHNMGKYTQGSTPRSRTLPSVALRGALIAKEGGGPMGDDKSDKRPGKIKEQQESYSLIDERYEIIEGVRYDFLASPKYAHQKMLLNFSYAFHDSCGNEGEILVAPMDVHLDEDNIFQPDVIYIAKERLDIVHDGFVYGVPDLVVEILSDSTGRRDKTIKKTVYERFGVKEYWLADPVYRTLDQFVLRDGRYMLEATLSEGDTLASPTIPCLTIDLDKIFLQNLRQ